MPKLKPLPYPGRLEARYRRQLHAYVVDMRRVTQPTLDAILAHPSWRQDAVADEWATMLAMASRKFRALWSDKRVRRMLEDLFERLNRGNVISFSKKWGKVVPIQSIGADWEAGMSSAFIQENVALIKSINNIHFTEIERMVMDATRNGLRVEVLKKQLRKEFNLSKSKASLIARDQVGKINGQLTRQRMSSAGIQEAEWSSSLDERVRPSHRKADGRVFDLKKGTMVDGEVAWPGSPIQCRCSAIPVLPDFED